MNNDIDTKLRLAIEKLTYVRCHSVDQKDAEDYVGKIYRRYILPLRKPAHDGQLPTQTHQLYTKVFELSRLALDWGGHWPPRTRLERLKIEIENAKSHIISLNDEIEETERRIKRLSREIKRTENQSNYGTDIRIDA